jgi:hypothetical protein
VAIIQLPKKTGELIGVNDSGFNMVGAVRTAITVAKFVV